MTERSFSDKLKPVKSVSWRFGEIIFSIHITDGDKTLKLALICEPGIRMILHRFMKVGQTKRSYIEYFTEISFTRSLL